MVLMSHGSKMSRHLDYIWPEFSSKVDVWGLFLIQYILNISIFNGNITLFSLHEITIVDIAIMAVNSCLFNQTQH